MIFSCPQIHRKPFLNDRSWKGLIRLCKSINDLLIRRFRVLSQRRKLFMLVVRLGINNAKQQNTYYTPKNTFPALYNTSTKTSKHLNFQYTSPPVPYNP